MLRSFDGWDGEHFSFGDANASAATPSASGPAPTSIAIDNGSDGPSATIPDSHLLFTAQFSRAGADLLLTGEDGKAFVVHDYFSADIRARLLSAEGAALSPDVVAALAGPLTPGQYAQAGAAQPAAQAVGRVVQASGDATIVRNGVAMAAQTGEAILKGDVLQTVTGTFGVTFNDGSTLNLTANSRLVVNEFVYDPKGSANSQLLDLVQGSLTFISGEVAHNGDMKIGTPVATMAIRGTVGGVTTANDGTVNFYVSQSATGAVVLDRSGTIIANVVQDGPLIIVRPVGPLQVLAEEVQKSPAQLATELAALQQIVSMQAVGQQIIQQFFQQDPNATPNPNPQSTDKVHAQIQIELQTSPTPLNDPSHNGDNAPPHQITATVTVITPPTVPGTPPTVEHDPIVVTIPANLAPINFGPLTAAATAGQALTFTGQSAISVFDADTANLTVTLSAQHGVLTLSGTAGLTFAAGDGDSDATMTFSGTQADINAALDGMKFTPDAQYTGAANVTVTTTDGNSTAAEAIAIDVDKFVHWNSTSGGDWFDNASNWTSQHIPGTTQSLDNVAITLPTGQIVTLGGIGSISSIGDLAVGPGVTLDVNTLNEGAPPQLYVFGQTDNDGSIKASNGIIDFQGDVVNNFAIEASDHGYINFEGAVTGARTLTARNYGALFFFGAVAGAVLLDGGNVEFLATSDASGATVTFGASGGTLLIDDATTFGGTITGFRPGSLIDFGVADTVMADAHVSYVSGSGEVLFSYSVGEDAQPIIDIGVVYSNDDYHLTDADFALLPDSTGGFSLAFNDFWIGGDGAAVGSPDSWSLGYVPDQNTAVTYNDIHTPAYLDLDGHPFHIAGLILGSGVEVTIVNGILDIGALDNSGMLTIDGGETSTLVGLDFPAINHADGSIVVNGSGAALGIYGGFDNFGTFEANNGAMVYAYSDITNEASGTFNVLNGASFTLTGTFTNYGTALVDPATFTVIGDVHNFGTIEAGPDGVFHVTREVGGGQFLISGGSMEFGGKVDSNVTVSFGSGHDTLIIDQSLKFYGAISDFGIGDQILDHDGVVADSFTVDPTEGGVVLHYTENGNVVSLALFGDYSSNNFAVSYSGGGIDIAYNQPPTIAAPATPVTDEDTPLFFGDLDKIALADPDTGALTVTLSADHGAISLSHLDDLNFSNGHGTADHAMTFSGSTDAINHALDGLKFTPDANYDGNAAAITVAASDGVGAPIERVIDITINSVNDAPELTGTLTADISIGGSHTLTTAELNFADPDDIASGVIFSVSNLDHGSVYVDGSVSTSFTGQQLAGGQVSFLQDGSGGADAGFSVSVEDGNEDHSTPVADAFHFVVGPTRDFEAGLQGWSVVGAVNTTTAEHFDGASSANLASAVSQTVATSQIESFVGIDSGTLAGLNNNNNNETPVAGSAMKATFYLNGGDTFSFDWKFQTHDYLPYNDFAFFSVTSGGATELADVASLGNTNGHVSATGWHETSFTAQDSGQYTFGFGVIDVRDSNVQSNLFIDHVHIATGTA